MGGGWFGRRVAPWLAVLLVLALGHAGCARQPEVCPHGLKIVVTVPPLAGLAKAVAPANSDVRALMRPGRSEHGYEFTPEDLAALAQADVVVYVGLGLEPRIEEFLRRNPSPARQVVCFADAVGISADPHAGHDHAPGEPCEHGHAVDVHLWLDPGLVERLVPAIHGAVERALRHRDTWNDTIAQTTSRQAEKLARDVRELDAELRQTLEPIRGQAIVTHHNAWPRLAERYGLVVAAVIREVQGGEPTPEAITRSVLAIREQGVRGIFVEPQFNPEAARRIALAAGVRVGQLDPLGAGDWFAMMRANAQVLVATLGAPLAPGS